MEHLVERAASNLVEPAASSLLDEPCPAGCLLTQPVLEAGYTGTHHLKKTPRSHQILGFIKGSTPACASTPAQKSLRLKGPEAGKGEPEARKRWPEAGREEGLRPEREGLRLEREGLAP